MVAIIPPLTPVVPVVPVVPVTPAPPAVPVTPTVPKPPPEPEPPEPKPPEPPKPEPLPKPKPPVPEPKPLPPEEKPLPLVKVPFLPPKIPSPMAVAQYIFNKAIEQAKARKEAEAKRAKEAKEAPPPELKIPAFDELSKGRQNELREIVSYGQRHNWTEQEIQDHISYVFTRWVFKDAGYVECGSEEWLPKEELTKLDRHARHTIIMYGIEYGNKRLQEEFDATHTKVFAGYMKTEDFDTLPPDLQEMAKTRGLSKVKRILDEEQKKYNLIKPFVTPDGTVDVAEALNKGVREDVLKDCLDISSAEMKEHQWAAEYKEANFFRQVQMAAVKDPWEFTKTVAVGIVPIYGTAKFWKDMQPWQKGVSVVGDILFFIPVVSGISAGVKGGMGLGRATLVTARGVIVSPFTALRHPVQTVKVLLSPVETLLRPGKIPLAVIWRGEYAPMSIMKVGAGPAPKLTRVAMEEISRLATLGKKAKVRLPTGEIINYSPTGLQNIMGSATIHTSSGALPFLGKGVKVQIAREPGLFTAPSGSYSLTRASATGIAPKYAMVKGGEIIGDLSEAGKVIDKHGKVVGNIKVGTKVKGISIKWVDGKMVRELSGKTIGTVTKDGLIIDKSGVAIGKLGLGGSVIDDAGVLIGWLPEGIKVVGEGEKVIAKLKSLPTFAVIRTEGVKQLPKWVTDAGSMAEMEKRAVTALSRSEMGQELLPVYKQYKKWIELENVYAPGTRLVPVLRNNKPVIMFTRGLSGERIPVVLLQEVSPDWFKQSLQLTKQLSEKGVPVKVRKVDFSKVKVIPRSSNKPLLKWFKDNPDATIYGGFAEYVQLGKRIPLDIDIAIGNPVTSANQLAKIIQQSSKFKARVVKVPKGGATVQIMRRGFWEKAIDLHPTSIIKKKLPYGLEPKAPIKVGGISMEPLGTQLQRLLVRMSEEWGEAPVRFTQLAERLGGKIDLGIGAKPPNLSQLYRLKARGAYNTVRDIFKKGLTKSSRVKLAEEIAPDLIPEVSRMIRIEDQLVRTSEALRIATGVQRTTLIATRRELATSYRNVSSRLRARLNDRVKILTRIVAELPPRYSPRTITRYRAELKRSPYNPRYEPVPYQRISTPRMERPPERVAPPRVPVPRVPRVPRAPRGPRVPAPPEVPRPPRVPTVPKPPLFPKPPVVPPVHIPEREAKEKRRKIELKGAICWRQGFIWKTIYPPYGKDDIMHTTEPPPGVKVVKGIRSAYKTITKLGVHVPREIYVDMGIMDVVIKKRGKKIRFKRDIKQKTKLGYAVGEPTLTRMR